MPISGYVAGGASEALEQVLDRRLKEQIRQQQEKEHAEQVAIQREQIDLQQRRDAAMDLERQEDRKWRQQQGDIATAGRTLQRTAPGEITPEIAQQIGLDPANVGLLTKRKVIDARPIAAPSVLPGGVSPQLPTIDARPVGAAAPAALGGEVTATPDTSGRQQFDVLEPTPEQAKEAKQVSDTDTYNEMLSRAPDEGARKVIAAQAARRGIKLDPTLVGATEAEKRQTATQAQIAAEDRAEANWQRHFGQSQAAQARAAALAREGKPPTSAQTTLAGYAARLEQAEPTLKKVEAAIVKMNPMSFEAQLWADKPWAQSTEMQQYAQAARNLINAVLRRESGAVISPTEFHEAQQQYLPVPGDKPETLKLKKENRELNMSMYKRGAGPAYQSVTDAMGGSDDDVIDLEIDPTTGELVQRTKPKGE